jgi:hypothetical protein
MTRWNRQSRFLALIVTALIVGFAPLIHALCIGQPSDTSSTHVMADGTVMTMPASEQSMESPSTDAPTNRTFESTTTSHSSAPDTSGLIGTIALSLLPAFIAAVLCWLFRKPIQDAISDPPNLLGQLMRAPPLLMRPFSVDLNRLSISRT